MPDRVALHVLWSHTRNSLESLRLYVREGRGVMETADFAHYGINSGIVKVLAPYDNTGPVKINSVFRPSSLLRYW